MQSSDICHSGGGRQCPYHSAAGVENNHAHCRCCWAKRPFLAQTLTFKLDYFDLNGRSYTSQQNASFGLNVGNTTPAPRESNQPRIVLTTYLVEPLPTCALVPCLISVSLSPTSATAPPAAHFCKPSAAKTVPNFSPSPCSTPATSALSKNSLPAIHQLTQQMIVKLHRGNQVSTTLPIAFSYPLGDSSANRQVLNLLVQKQPSCRQLFTAPFFPV
ncbi:MAG: hypothetical protein H6668_19070 [Ardenticatenaceae bacterium]|nr:hypothetical protein [Ardenticatenaceae bacterium]